MAKLAFGSQLRKAMLEGVHTTAKVVVPNYGPSGKNTFVEPKLDIPMAMSSGARILQDFTLEEPLHQMGSAILCEAVKTLGSHTGDGVSAAVVLCSSMLRTGEKMLAAGVNPMLLRKGMEKASEAAAQAIWNGAVQPEGASFVYQVALNSSKNQEVAKILSDAFEKAGDEGIVTIEDTQDRDTRIRYGGIQYEYGLLASEFANDETGTVARQWNPFVLLVDKKIENIYELQTILEEASKKKVPLLIIAKDIKPEVLRIILMNVRRKTANVVVASAPGHGESRCRHMQALAAKLGAVLIDDQCGIELKNCGLEICGRVESAQIDRKQTCLRGIPNGNPELVELLKKRTKRMLEEADDAYEMEKLQLTQSILSGQTVTILVGGISEVAMFEQKQLLENALSAVCTARETGILPGGGKGFLLGIPAVKECINSLSGDEVRGAQCVLRALQEPVRTIAENAGVSGAVVVDTLLSNDQLFYGYDAAAQQYADLSEHGLLDPAGTIVGALTVAAETAAAILTVEAAVY